MAALKAREDCDLARSTANQFAPEIYPGDAPRPHHNKAMMAKIAMAPPGLKELSPLPPAAPKVGDVVRGVRRLNVSDFNGTGPVTSSGKMPHNLCNTKVMRYFCSEGERFRLRTDLQIDL